MQLKLFLFIVLLFSAFNLVSAEPPPGGVAYTEPEGAVPEKFDFQADNVGTLNEFQIEANFQSIPSFRFDELDQILLGRAIKKKYNLNDVEIKVGNQVNTVEIEDDSFYFDDVDYLEITPTADYSTTIINNGQNVRYSNGRVQADYADSVIKGDAISANVDFLDAGKDEYFIGEADYLMTDSITIKNIKNSTFKIDNQKVEIFASDNYIINITDKSSAQCPQLPICNY
ncbi:hypothetical protein HYV81_02830 [Candidatus Woesearchaeota archaeon]|nr:hypothetical protein [Candidatus Woesearchaeota archaeon]